MIELKTYLDSFYPLARDTWDAVRALFVPATLPKGGFFIEDGQIAEKVAFLKGGVMRAFYRDASGAEYNKHFFTSPCFIGGYASLITGKPNQINQQALTTCEYLTANFRQLSLLYDSHPDLERAARKMAESYFVDKEQREIEIVLLDANQRYRIFRRQYPTLEQLIPQYHIASYLGITPTQLSRIRKSVFKSSSTKN